MSCLCVNMPHLDHLCRLVLQLVIQLTLPSCHLQVSGKKIGKQGGDGMALSAKRGLGSLSNARHDTDTPTSPVVMLP